MKHGGEIAKKNCCPHFVRGEIKIKVEKVLNIHMLPKFQLGNLGTWSAGFNIDTTVRCCPKKLLKKA